jgi:hypothetical protein
MAVHIDIEIGGSIQFMIAGEGPAGVGNSELSHPKGSRQNATTDWLSPPRAATTPTTVLFPHG